MVEIINDKDLWNDSLLNLKSANPYQVYQWGEYKERFGWNALRLKINNNGRICFIQITYKIKFNVFLGWVIGNIAGDISAFEKKIVFDFIKDKFLVKKIYIRANFSDEKSTQNSFDLYCNGWETPPVKKLSDYTFFIDLNSNGDLMGSFSKNWRKNLKRGIENNKDIKVEQLSKLDSNIINGVFKEFLDLKSELALPSLEEIEVIKRSLGENIYIAYSKVEGKVVALRGFLFFKDTAIDFWAAANSKARESYSSYVLLYELLNKAAELGLKTYDMSGIDPINNKGVYNFKKGLRARLVEKSGEWEMSDSKLISFLINYIYLR